MIIESGIIARGEAIDGIRRTGILVDEGAGHGNQSATVDQGQRK